MVDMTKHIIRKTDQLNAEDLLGGPRTIKITDIRETSKADQPISLYFEGDNNKPYKPNLSMRKVLLACWGRDGKAYVGRSMTIYNDPSVTWAGQAVGGVRISHLSDMKGPKTIPITITRGKKKPIKIGVLDVKSGQAPQYTKELSELEDAASRGTDILRKAVERLRANDLEGFRFIKNTHLNRLLGLAEAADKELQALVDGQGGKDQDAPEDDIPF